MILLLPLSMGRCKNLVSLKFLHMHLNYLGAVYPKHRMLHPIFYYPEFQVTLLVGNRNGLLLYPLYTWVMSKTLSFLLTASIDGPTLTHHYYPEVIVYIRFTLIFCTPL